MKSYVAFKYFEKYDGTGNVHIELSEKRKLL